MTNETQQTKNIAIIVAVIALIVAAVAGIYVLTGPHSAVEAVLRTPLIGEQANYEANGKITVDADAYGVSLTNAADIPFKVRAAGNRYRIDFFKSSFDMENPAYTIYMTYSSKEGLQHYEEGKIADIIKLAVVAYSFVGEQSTLEDLPDPSNMISTIKNISPAELANFTGKMQFERNDTGYCVIIYGKDIVKLLDSAPSQNEESGEVPLEEILENARIVTAYDNSGNPQKLTLEGASKTIDIDTKFAGTVSGNITINAQADFSRLGQVLPNEVAFPVSAQK